MGSLGISNIENLDKEVDYYSDILEQVSLILNDEDQAFIWKCHQIIDLMNYFKESKDKSFIKNALIIILSLFENFYIDLVLSKGIDLDEMSIQEKEILIETLKDEIDL